jgi:hypothetical protein
MCVKRIGVEEQAKYIVGIRVDPDLEVGCVRPRATGRIMASIRSPITLSCRFIGHRYTPRKESSTNI